MSFAAQRKPAPARAARPVGPAPAAVTAQASPTRCGATPQTKLAVNEPGGADEREADQVADHVKAQLSGQTVGSRPTITPLSAPVAQRKCATCAQEDSALAQRQGEGGPVTTHEVDLQPSGGESMPEGPRRRMEGAFGRTFQEVRVHSDAPAHQSAQELSARAYTLGNHIYFARGQYQPGTPDGDHLLAHELTHVVQQGGMARRAQLKCAACAAEDKTGLAQALGVQRSVWDYVPSVDDVVDAGSRLVDTGARVVDAGVDAAYDVGEFAVDQAVAAGGFVADGVNAGLDLIDGIAREFWDMATSYADALGGGNVSVSGTSLIVTVAGPVSVCPTLPFQFDLPGQSKSFPLLFGAVEIAGPVLGYGQVSAFASLTPELSGQLGPCAVSGVRIVIDPFGPSISASGSLSATAALGLGAALDVGLEGELGLMIVWPDPPFVIMIPVVGLQAGLEGFARGIVATRLTVSGAMSGSFGGFSLTANGQQTLGLAADAGVAGFGELDFLGQNLCRLYWPLLSWHDDMAIDSGFDVALSISRAGASASLSLIPPTISPLGFDDLGIAIPRDMFTDDCPLCSILERAGLLPSMLGGEWKPNSPGRRHPGPLEVYPNAPPILSGSKCRGACGPDCETCNPPADPTLNKRTACVETQGERGPSHYFWVYPNFHECNTHEGCREHDACYDWSARFGERGPLGILGPVHRLCDLEAICTHGLRRAVGWIGGAPPYDGTMDFSDKPKKTGACPGACPEETESDGLTTQRIHLPSYEILQQFTPLFKKYDDDTGWIELFEVPVDIPYLPPVLLGLFAKGLLHAYVTAHIGPLTLQDVWLDVNPADGEHLGSAQLRLYSDIEAGLDLTGQLEGRAGWGCLAGVIDLTVLSGLLGLMASAKARLSGELTDQVDVACRDGQIVLDNELALKPCLDLLFALDAALKLELFHRFEIFHRRWHLADWQWNRCWPLTLSATSTPLGEWDFDLMTDAIDMADMLRALLSDERSDTPGVGASPGLPRDPARTSGDRNPCGSDVTPDDQCGSAALPLTQVTFTPGARGQGGVVRAAPLSKCEGNTHGSPPDQAIYGAQFNCMRGIETPAGSGKTESRFWVRAHLLHGETSGSGGRDLHGPGDDMRNLIISDKSFNGLMRTGPERFALDAIHDPQNPQVLWYETTVRPFAAPMDFYGDEVRVAVGQWDTAANAPGPQTRSFGPFTTKRAVPPCP